MFNAKKTELEISSDKPVQGNGTTIINSGTTLKGDISSNNDIRIDGQINGNIRCTAKIVIGSSGVVEGDIFGNLADIVGKVTGSVRVKELLQLRGECVVKGNIYAGKLQIEPTATFNGQCHMGANVVDISATEFAVEEAVEETN